MTAHRLPTDWKSTRIKDVCRVVPGYAFSSRDWTDQGIPVVKIKNIRPDCTVDLSDIDHVPASILKPKLEKFFLNDGDIVIAMTGATAGKVGRVRTSTKVLLNQRVAKFEPFGIVNEFFWSVVSSQEYQRRFFSLADGAAQPNMSGSQIEGVDIPLPPISVQERVASILSAYDDLIENNTRRIAILEEMPRRIYEEWFVHFRFPGHEEVRLLESDLGLVPEKWVTCRLDEIASVNRKSIKKGHEPTDILYVDIASVSPGTIEKKEPFAFAEAPGRARRCVTHGDIIWSCVRPNRRSYALVIRPEETLVVSTGFAVISPTAVPFSYSYLLLTTDRFVHYLANRATGAAYPAVTAKDFGDAIVLKPPKSVLAQFHSAMEPMLLLCEELKRKNTNLRTQRDLLLPKLISGEIDVSEVPEPESVAA